MPDWTIRKAQESDIARLVELRLALQEQSESCNPRIWRLSEDGRERLRDQFVQLLSDEDACILVALDDRGTIVGMIAGQVRKNDSYVPAISASIGRLFVSEAWRGRGIGTELVKRVCQFFATRRVEDISIDYIAGNAEGTMFWSKLGFQPRMILAGTSLKELEKRLAGA